MSFFRDGQGKVKIVWRIVIAIVGVLIINTVWSIFSNIVFASIYRAMTGVKVIDPLKINDMVQTNPEFMLFGTLNNILVLIFICLLVKRIEKIKMRDIGLNRKSADIPTLFYGVIIGIVNVGAVILFGIVLGFYSEASSGMVGFTTTSILRFFAVGAISSILTAIMEETLYHGYILRNLLKSVGNKRALIISSILFMLADAFSNQRPVDLLGVVLAGVFLGYLYMYTSSLPLTMAVHSVWHFVLLNVAKIEEYAFYKGPTVLKFKLHEDFSNIASVSGITTIVINLLSIIVLHLIIKSKNKPLQLYNAKEV